MSPWNYPFLLSLTPLVDAIAAGNTVIVKPSAYAPATAEIVSRIICEVFPPFYATVVTGGRKENTCLLNEHFDFIHFIFPVINHRFTIYFIKIPVNSLFQFLFGIDTDSTKHLPGHLTEKTFNHV